MVSVEQYFVPLIICALFGCVGVRTEVWTGVQRVTLSYGLVGGDLKSLYSLSDGANVNGRR